MIQEKTVYTTDDGKQFSTLVAARMHERNEGLVVAVSGIILSNSDYTESEQRLITGFFRNNIADIKDIFKGDAG
jgi:hypothetical protein